MDASDPNWLEKIRDSERLGSGAGLGNRAPQLAPLKPEFEQWHFVPFQSGNRSM
jgi:hypothetical protein